MVSCPRARFRSHPSEKPYRLIIDRSILLLLSASKCCLRQGGECLQGLEARRSTAAQIRVSMSIIMAVVKCSVFGPAAACSSVPDLGAGHRPPVAQQQRPMLHTLLELQRPATGCGPKFGRTPGTRWSGAEGAQLFASCSSPADWLVHQHQACAADEAPLPDHCYDPPAPANRCQDQRARPAALVRPLEIINYFYKTFNGTMSAHDAISRLQVSIAASKLGFRAWSPVQVAAGPLVSSRVPGRVSR